MEIINKGIGSKRIDKISDKLELEDLRTYFSQIGETVVDSIPSAALSDQYILQNQGIVNFIFIVQTDNRE